jgi:CPA2 family monovalent cation:H+ antiporter-2
MDDLTVLRDLVVIFAISVVVVALLKRIGVPAIAGFIVAGILIGPAGLRLVHDAHEVELLAEIGVALLLFGIGLELHLGQLRRLWRLVLGSGALQVGLTAATGTLIARALSLPLNQSIFIGLLIAISSTAIVLRGLESRGESDAPHGRLALGILVFQDLCVVPMMLAIPLLAAWGETATPLATLGMPLLKAVAVLGGVLLAAWFVVPRVLHWVAQTRQRDLFVLTVFVICIGTAWSVTHAGVSLALGAFLAGIVVSESEYRHQALTDVIPFREIFASLFFVSVGMLLNPALVWQNPAGVIGLALAIIIGKFLIVFLVVALMRLPLRVCVLTAAVLSQVGEFSFVLTYAAAGTGLLPTGAMNILLPAVIITMLVTPLAMAAGPSLAAGASRIGRLSSVLGVQGADEADAKGRRQDHVIIAGYGVTGRELARALRKCGVPYVIVDLNPDNVRAASSAGEPAYFGDVTSPDVLEHLSVKAAREVVLVVNDPSAAIRATHAVRRVAPDAHILVRSRYAADVAPLLKAGASDVVPAEIEAAVEVAARVLARHEVCATDVEDQAGRIRAAQDD